MFPVDQWGLFQDSDDKYKLITPYWDSVTDWLSKILLTIALLAGVLQLTQGTLICIPVVECDMTSSASKTNSFCKGYKATSAKDVTLLVKLKDRRQYDFVESKCGHTYRESQEYISLLPYYLFIEAVVILLVDRVWCRFKTIRDTIDYFLLLVTECHNIPGQVSAIENVWKNQNTSEPSLDNSEAFKVKALREKVSKFKRDVENKNKTNKAYHYCHGIFRFVIVLLTLGTNVYFSLKMKREMICRIGDKIFSEYSYFKCENGLSFIFLAITIAFILILGIYVVFSFCVICWSRSIRKKIKRKQGRKNSQENSQRRIRKYRINLKQDKKKSQEKRQSNMQGTEEFIALEADEKNVQNDNSNNEGSFTGDLAFLMCLLENSSNNIYSQRITLFLNAKEPDTRATGAPEGNTEAVIAQEPEAEAAVVLAVDVHAVKAPEIDASA